MLHNMADIVVLGAGVIGLQTAITLLEAGFKVEIVSRHWPGDESIEYTSPWAGAIWRTHATPGEVERCEWDIESYMMWMKLIENEPEKAKEMGLKHCPITIYSGDFQPVPWYAQHVQNFKTLQSSHLSSHGHTFDSISINPITYLSYLHDRVRELGATLLRAELPASKGLAFALQLHQANLPAAQSTTVVNCTGLGAKDLCGDGEMYPIRGQTLLARLSPTPAHEILLWDGEEEVTYIVPRPNTDTFVLGGTKDAHNFDSTPTPEISRGIIKRCQTLLAAQGQHDIHMEVLAEQVGLRPGRAGGARIEIEKVNTVGGVISVVHNYGHAGAGYQNSVGSAKKVLVLVRQLLETGH
ncbi:FAD dependent oxidoreductase [Pyrenochaeta sp. MPI-SDFR-AT-0127]|nr:FAD dependent oxidoreductase [Pyrenochaeta sp. MPI-SDFR-AT-0127]